MALMINDAIWVNGLFAKLGDALKGFHLLPQMRYWAPKFEPVPCVSPDCVWCKAGYPQIPLRRA